MLINYLDLVTLKHCDVNEFAGIVTTAVLDYQQPGRDDLQHKAGLLADFELLPRRTDRHSYAQTHR